jgi:hypothetical protein
MALSIDSTIHAGDILTSVTVAISVVSLILSQAKDRRAGEAETAKAARGAAARVVAQLDRAARVRVAVYANLLPEFIDLSRALETAFDPIAARDRLWRDMHVASANAAQTLLDERIATAYVDLVGFHPRIREAYVAAFAAIERESANTVDAFLIATQKKLLALEKDEDKYTSAIVGNLLRAEATKQSDKLADTLEAIVAPVRDGLFAYIERDDRTLARGRDARRG